MAVQPSDLIPNSVYNLTMHAPAVLGSRMRLVTVKSVLAYDQSATAEAARKHLGLISSLPSGTERDVKKIFYVTVELSSGKREVLALCWIESLEQVQNSSLKITIPSAAPGDISTIRSVLVAAGFTDAVFEM